jgi:hypothetical protein
MTIGVAALVATATLGLAASSPLEVTLSAPGHTPRINVHWNYSLKVTRGGKPVAAKLSEAIVDPIGGVHPVQFGKNTKNITNWPINGTFKDFIIWPPSSRGVPLKLRITVKVGTAKKVVTYAVTPRS